MSPLEADSMQAFSTQMWVIAIQCS